MLQHEQEAAARLKKGQAEAQKQAQSLEVGLREAQEKRSQLENSRMELEKQLTALQAELEVERRDRNLGTETIADLQGEADTKEKSLNLEETRVRVRISLLAKCTMYTRVLLV